MKLKMVLAIVALGTVFCFGAYTGQKTFEPQVVTETQVVEVEKVVYKTLEKVVPVEKVVEVPVEKVVIKEVPLELRDFSSLEELDGWLFDTPKIIIFGGNAGNSLFDCDNFALGLQQEAINNGYLLNFENIEYKEYNSLFKKMKIKSSELHAINLAIIGNDVYYIEPQTDEVVWRGKLD